MSTWTDQSIYHEHVLRLAHKLASGAYERATKYPKLTELQDCVRTFQKTLDRNYPVPTEIEPLLAYAAKLKAEYDAYIERKLHQIRNQQAS